MEIPLAVTLPRVGGPEQRAVLAMLVCHANRVVSDDQLLEEVLSDHPAQLAGDAARSDFRLRKALADGGDTSREWPSGLSWHLVSALRWH
jgi:DNA-binding winged helix-turn-helix (wHTH) protein